MNQRTSQFDFRSAAWKKIVTHSGCGRLAAEKSFSTCAGVKNFATDPLISPFSRVRYASHFAHFCCASGVSLLSISDLP